MKRNTASPSATLPTERIGLNPSRTYICRHARVCAALLLGSIRCRERRGRRGRVLFPQSSKSRERVTPADKKKSRTCVCLCVCVFFPTYFGDSPRTKARRVLHFAVHSADFTMVCFSVLLNQPGSHRSEHWGFIFFKDSNQIKDGTSPHFLFFFNAPVPAFIFIARSVQPSLSLVDVETETEFGLLTNLFSFFYRFPLPGPKVRANCRRDLNP